MKADLEEPDNESYNTKQSYLLDSNTKGKVRTFTSRPIQSWLVGNGVCCISTYILIGCSFTWPDENQSASCGTGKSSENVSRKSASLGRE